MSWWVSEIVLNMAILFMEDIINWYKRYDQKKSSPT